MKTFTAQDLQTVGDLADRMPPFGRADLGGEEVIMSRSMAGLGANWHQSGFLGLVIALEAALLRGAQAELSYRFALHGALFLADERDARKTFDALRNVYEVRSKVVHGVSKLRDEKRRRAEQDVVDLTRATLLKGIRDRWPDTETLRARALGF